MSRKAEEAFAPIGLSDELDAGEDDECPEEGFEEFLVDAFDDDRCETGGCDG